jgi:hypothetical protein
MLSRGMSTTRHSPTLSFAVPRPGDRGKMSCVPAERAQLRSIRQDEHAFPGDEQVTT